MDWLVEPEIIFEDNHLLVVNKPVNMPVCLDASLDPNLLDILKDYLKKRDNKPGNVYLALLHRLDRPVGGLMVFSKTDKAASRLNSQLRNKSWQKTYLAVVEGKTAISGSFCDRLLKDNKNNIVKIDPSGKEAKLDYQSIAYRNGHSLVKIHLLTGRSHQIRVQFAAANHPLWGDQKYNPQAKPGQQIALFAAKLSFIHPISQQPIDFIIVPKTYPFSWFENIDNYLE